MATTRVTKVMGVNDAKISPITTDNSTTLTYGTAVDVAGIRKVSVDPQFVSKDLRGDEQILDRYSKLELINWSFENAKISLDAIAVLVGGNVTDGTGKVTYSLTADDVAEYFKLEAKADYTDASGDIHIILWKCKAESVKYELTGEDYAICSASGTAIPTIKDGKVQDIVINDTATAIS